MSYQFLAMNELAREDVLAAVERTGPSRVPMHFMHYYNKATIEKYEPQIAKLRGTYPDDVVRGDYRKPDNPNWESLATNAIDKRSGLDQRVIIEDYTMVAAIAERIRSFGRGLDLASVEQQRKDFPKRYALGYTWFTIF